ncbi:IPT/TIG domain-containing protein [Flagellimonas nanhaiensis]|uniref:IPT/TIG domain-containing protein n=1 Tax=Flagellimonas nanhaiensis TaxID=2292706 RepID=A0A371JP73_9FLAO|nr:IPT/TIG domain-containing protein [Allomuricauda nanhaiensis]RDY59332.1 hypothetical protein DX873_08015 [Allomuricauda nanhaiensis]
MKKHALTYASCILVTLLFVFCSKDDTKKPDVPESNPPTISSFTPSNGTVGTGVTIKGSNFSATASGNIVKFNGTKATVNTASATQLEVTVPSGATTGKISVEVDGEKATSEGTFTVTEPSANAPTITGFDPTEGTPGTTVEVSGTNFSTTMADNLVKFNGTTANVSAATATLLTVQVPNGAETGPITVTVDGETTQSSDDFTVNEPSANAPTITSFDPTEGTPGTTVEVSGINFSTTMADNLVKFNGTTANVSAATATLLTVQVPNGAETGPITVTVDGETTQSNEDFTVLVPPTISISGFAPDQENVGAEVVINGANFDLDPANNTVKFNGVDAEVTSANSTQLTVTVPEGATTGTITVTVGEQTGESTEEFTVGPWRKLADFPGEARRDGVMATLEDENGKLFIIAGLGFSFNGNTELDDIWLYNPETDEWTEQNGSFPGGKRYGPFSFTIDNKWFVGAGNDGQQKVNDCYRYNPLTKSWVVVATPATPPGLNGRTFTVNQKGYLFGGTNTAHFQEFDTNLNSWNDKNTIGNNPRIRPVSFVIDGIGYIATGYNNSDNVYYKDIHRYDPNLDSWSEMQSLDIGLERYGAIGFALNGKGYLGTGIIHSGTPKHFSDLFEYDPNSNSWSQKTSYPGAARYGASSTTLNNKAYVSFGETKFANEDRNDFWEYTPALDN